MVSRENVTSQVDDDAPAAFAALTGAYDRVLRVSEKLRLANAERCGESLTSSLGWVSLADRDFGGLDMRALAKRFMNVGRAPVVLALVPDGAAQRAGVQVGDEVLSVGGTRVRSASQVTHAENALAATGDSISIARGGKELELPVTPARVCRPDVTLDDWPTIAAWASRGHVQVSLRLVELANDDELAFSLAHALALVILDVNTERTDLPLPEPQSTALAVELSERAGFSTAGVERLLQLQATEEPWMVIGVRNPLANPYWRPKGDTEIGWIPRRIVALRAVRASR